MIIWSKQASSAVILISFESWDGESFNDTIIAAKKCKIRPNQAEVIHRSRHSSLSAWFGGFNISLSIFSDVSASGILTYLSRRNGSYNQKPDILLKRFPCHRNDRILHVFDKFGAIWKQRFRAVNRRQSRRKRRNMCPCFLVSHSWPQTELMWFVSGVCFPIHVFFGAPITWYLIFYIVLRKESFDDNLSTSKPEMPHSMSESTVIFFCQSKVYLASSWEKVLRKQCRLFLRLVLQDLQ